MFTHIYFEDQCVACGMKNTLTQLLNVPISDDLDAVFACKSCKSIYFSNHSQVSI